MKVGYTLLGGKIYGAEKRVFKLVLSDWFEKNDSSSFLIVNQQLIDAARQHDELDELMDMHQDKILALPVSLTSSRAVNSVIFLASLIFYKFKYKLDIIHAYLNARNQASLLGLIGIKVVFEITSPDIADSFIKSYSKRFFIYRSLYRINCVSRSVYKRLLEKLSEKERDNLALVYHSLPFTRVPVHGDIDIGSKNRTIIYASRFIKRKNVLNFALIARDILKRYPEWKVKMFGSGPLEDELRSILKDQIADGSAYVGYCDNMIEEFINSSITCSFIYPDNYPSQSLFEAMACGNALVVSDRGDSGTFVQGNNGILSSETEHQSDIEYLINNPDIMQDMQSKSIKLYKEKFNEGNYYSKLFEIYS